MLDWLDAHSGSVLGVATLVLVFVTAYYAWTTRALVRENHITLQAAARATLQARMDRISEIFIHEPTLFAMLDDGSATGEEEDGRFHVSNMLLGVFEEAYIQYALERTMSAADWSAWEATADVVLPKHYIARYWGRIARTFEPSFQRFVNARVGVETTDSPPA